MNIKVLGMGCSKCMKMYDATKEAVAELGIEAEVEKVEDIKKIMSYGVMGTPALVVNEKVVIAGKSANKKEIMELLK